jgi:RNA polymerase sigma-70 factor (ECF subfamily)
MASIDVEYLQLVTRHQPAIYGYIRSLAPAADIEDILQETNLVLWEKSASFEPGSNFKAFAFRIAHFKTLEALRSQRRRHWLVFDSDLLESIAERQAEVDRLAENQQAALRRCLLNLSPEEHRLIQSRYTHRKTVREIARDTGRSEGALQQLFFRLRNSLRTCIEAHLVREGGAT